jgi:hypothetical protein
VKENPLRIVAKRRVPCGTKVAEFALNERERAS